MVFFDGMVGVGIVGMVGIVAMVGMGVGVCGWGDASGVVAAEGIVRVIPFEDNLALLLGGN